MTVQNFWGNKELNFDFSGAENSAAAGLNKHTGKTTCVAAYQREY